MDLEARPGAPFFVCGALGRRGVHPSLPEECVASTEQSSERIPRCDRLCPNCEQPVIDTTYTRIMVNKGMANNGIFH